MATSDFGLLTPPSRRTFFFCRLFPATPFFSIRFAPQIPPPSRNMTKEHNWDEEEDIEIPGELLDDDVVVARRSSRTDIPLAMVRTKERKNRPFGPCLNACVVGFWAMRSKEMFWEKTGSSRSCSNAKGAFEIPWHCAKSDGGKSGISRGHGHYCQAWCRSRRLLMGSPCWSSL